MSEPHKRHLCTLPAVELLLTIQNNGQEHCFPTKGAYVADLVTQTCELELSIGDTIQVGDQFLTVVDIEGDEILFQLDTDNPAQRDATASSAPRSCR
ncbi:hypothetical protein V6x_22460 [Gimesia chilikensis]|uniref:Uncharacterized protein n=1 Tax=Gimesia chilikensis TaxID=2605989 RepID=A0A517WBA4_9PLAN|nr:hypothetical protein V6x_22460 [Gimesia chilikensis]